MAPIGAITREEIYGSAGEGRSVNGQAPARPRAIMSRRSKAARRLLSLTAITAAILLAMQVPVAATPLGSVIDVQGQGLSVAEGGVGWDSLGNGTRSLTVTIGGPVQNALLCIGRSAVRAATPEHTSAP